jgi:glutamyl-tRNA reductase
MKLLVLGLNHKTAPVDVRERLAFGPDIIVGALRDLTNCDGVAEGVVLSTCNRTEIYCAVQDCSEEAVRHWLSRFHGVEL